VEQDFLEKLVPNQSDLALAFAITTSLIQTARLIIQLRRRTLGAGSVGSSKEFINLSVKLGWYIKLYLLLLLFERCD